jgi:hypothetical protein
MRDGSTIGTSMLLMVDAATTTIGGIDCGFFLAVVIFLVTFLLCLLFVGFFLK